jgi:hypothetical protein
MCINQRQLPACIREAANAWPPFPYWKERPRLPASLFFFVEQEPSDKRLKNPLGNARKAMNGAEVSNRAPWRGEREINEASKIVFLSFLGASGASELGIQSHEAKV